MTDDIKSQLLDLARHVGGANQDLMLAVAEYIGRLERRQIPPSWSSDGNEWSAISGDGVLDVRGSKADIDVVISWRQAKDRLAWFEDEYKKSQAREAQLKAEVTRLKAEVERLDGLLGREGDLKARYDRLLTAFHDATRRPIGVTPDTGLEFYDHHLADEAEARRTRYGRGPK